MVVCNTLPFILLYGFPEINLPIVDLTLPAFSYEFAARAELRALEGLVGGFLGLI
jgi:hypothetical protein